MKEKKVNYLGNFYPGIGLGLIVSYEDGYVYIMAAIPFYQFYLDFKIFKKWNY
jgi:hypothetical protein